MTEKRFTLSSVGFTDEAILHDEDVPIGNWNVHRKDIVDLLNELAEENKALRKQLQTEHTMLDNAILLERTRMGKNCLKQFREAIQ